MGTIKVYLKENDVIVGNTVFLKLDANNKFHFDKCEDDMYYDGHSVYFDNEEGKYYYEEPDEEEKLLFEKHMELLETVDIKPEVWKIWDMDDNPISAILDIKYKKNVETSSRLAHNAMIDELFRQEIIISEEEVYQDDGTYFDFAQKVFDRHYDYFYNELYSTTYKSKEEIEKEE